jgi:hypothetical protein
MKAVGITVQIYKMDFKEDKNKSRSAERPKSNTVPVPSIKI